MNLEGLGELANTLTEDAIQAMKELKANNDQFHRRSFIRCYFSFVESYAFIMRQVLITIFLDEDETGMVQQPLDRITLHKLSLLFEEAPILKENGKLRLQQQKISLINQLAFTIKLYKDEFKLPNDFLGDNGWKEFQEAVKIRNQLTHPKSISDLVVSQQDITIISKSMRWFQDMVKVTNEAVDTFLTEQDKKDRSSSDAV